MASNDAWANSSNDKLNPSESGGETSHLCDSTDNSRHPENKDDCETDSCDEEPIIVKVECYRYVILMCYIGLNGVISLGQNGFSPIA